jgi:signal transduction histidine kinase
VRDRIRRVFEVPPVDAVLAAVVSVAMVGPALVPYVQPWWVVLLAVLASVPVLWRRAALLTSGLVVGTATTLLTISYPSLPHSIVLLFLPFGALVWTYTFAAAAIPPPLRVTVIVVQGAAVVLSLVLPGENLDTFRYVVTAFVAAYAAGVGTRARDAQRAAERERARRLEEERASAITHERTRIARDMHDILTHSVGLIVVQAEAGASVVQRDPVRGGAVFETIAATGRDAITQLRLILGTLRGPVTREPQPGLDAVPALVEQARQAGLNVALEERGTARALPSAAEVAAYRIVQESLTNALRHSRGGVRVLLEWADGTLTVQIASGGASARRFREGHGIVGMRERAAACGGNLRVDPGGFTVTATLPIG